MLLILDNYQFLLAHITAFSKAYIPPEHEPICVGASRWVQPSRAIDFADTNMLGLRRACQFHIICVKLGSQCEDVFW